MEALERYENKIERLEAVIAEDNLLMDRVANLLIEKMDEIAMLKRDIDYARNAIEYMISEKSRNAGDLEIVGNIALNYLAGLEGEDDE